jgi:hypothetical protein
MATVKTLGTGFNFQESKVPVRPTLFIAMGGSGMRTLRALRRQFLMRSVSKADLPCIRYLYLDTDLQGFQDGTKEADIPGVKFDDHEMLNLTLPQGEFESWVKNPVTNRHIHAWLDEKVAAMPGMVNGASQSRQAGRLAFFAHYHKIESKLNALQAALINQDTDTQMRRPVSEGGPGYSEYDGKTLEIVLLFSLAGGTGAGCFLDMAFLLRHLSRNHWNHATLIHGYSFLPPLFFTNPSEDMGQKTHANAMAALRELEYYSSRKDILEKSSKGGFKLESEHDFQVQWEARGKEHRIMGPPFDLLYLIDNQTDSSAPLRGEAAKEAFEMVATWHFLKFSGNGFAARIRSDGNNMQPYLSQDVAYLHRDEDGKDVHSEQFGQRLCSLGLSRVHVPADEIRRACSARMGIELVDFWLRPNMIQGDVRRAVDDLFEDLHIHPENMLKRFTQADPSTNWESRVNSDINTSINRLKGKVRGQSRRSLATEVDREYNRLKELVDMPPSSDPSAWGPVAHSIRISLPPQVRRDTESRVSECFHGWLKTEARGPRWVAEALPRLGDQLKQHITVLEQNQVKDQGSEEESRSRAQKLKGFIQSEQSTTIPQHASLNALLDGLGTALRDHLQAIRRRMARGMILEHHKWLVSHLEERLALIRQIEGGLADVRIALDTDLSAADRGEESFSHVKLHSPGAYTKYYTIRRPGENIATPIGATQIRQLETGIWSSLTMTSAGREQRITGLHELPQYLRSRGWQTLKRVVSESTAAFFSPKNNQMDFNLAEHLNEMDEASLTAYRNTIRQWSEPWSARPTKDPDIHCLGLMRIGIDPDHRQHPELQKWVRHLGETSPYLIGVPTLLDGDTDSFWVASEVYGLPAFSIRNIGNYRDAYDRMLSGDTQRHSTKHIHIFPPIQHLEDEEVTEHLRIIGILLSAILLGIVKVEEKEDKISRVTRCEFYFDDKSKAPPDKVYLMHWDQAIRLLKNNRRYQTYISEKLLAILGSLEHREIEDLLLALFKTKQAGGRFGIRKVNDASDPNIKMVCAEFTECDRLMQILAEKRGWSMEQISEEFGQINKADCDRRLAKYEDANIVLFVPTGDVD